MNEKYNSWAAAQYREKVRCIPLLYHHTLPYRGSVSEAHHSSRRNVPIHLKRGRLHPHLPTGAFRLVRRRRKRRVNPEQQ